MDFAANRKRAVEISMGYQLKIAWSLIFIQFGLLCASGALLVIPSPLCARAADATVTSDEMAVYGALLNWIGAPGGHERILVAESTSTFACGGMICNGFSMSGCNGLRSAGESPAQRLQIVKRDLPLLRPETLDSFEKRNQQCASIRGTIPTGADYRYLNDPDIPKDWKYTYLVYVSRVGFNADHTQALVDLSAFSATDGAKSGGAYISLRNRNGKWEVGATSAVWQLTQ
jgi:hypothetical protein